MKNFHERNNSSHYYYHPHQDEVSPGQKGEQPIKHLLQHLILMQVTIGSFLVPSGRKEEMQLYSLFPGLRKEFQSFFLPLCEMNV